MLHGSNVLIVHHVFRPDNSVQILEVGASIPWHACALGKAIAAYLPEAARRAAARVGELIALTGRTDHRPRRTRGDARSRSREDGYAFEDEEAIVGEAEIAAPVFDDLGHSVGAIGVVGPVERLAARGRPASTLVAAVRETLAGSVARHGRRSNQVEGQGSGP